MTHRHSGPRLSSILQRLERVQVGPGCGSHSDSRRGFDPGIGAHGVVAGHGKHVAVTELSVEVGDADQELKDVTALGRHFVRDGHEVTHQTAMFVVGRGRNEVHLSSGQPSGAESKVLLPQGQHRSEAVAVVGHVELVVPFVVNECGSCLGQILGAPARSSQLEDLVEVVFAGTTQNDSVRSLVHPRSLADASVLGEARSASLRSTASVGSDLLRHRHDVVARHLALQLGMSVGDVLLDLKDE